MFQFREGWWRVEHIQRNDEFVCLVPASPDKADLKSVDEWKENGAEEQHSVTEDIDGYTQKWEKVKKYFQIKPF